MRRDALGEKVYGLIISRLEGDRLVDQSYQSRILHLAEKGVGGFILFGGEKDIVSDFIHKLHSLADYPFIIASDIERGAGQQVIGTTYFPPQMAVASAVRRNNAPDIEMLRNMVSCIAEEAVDVGINMPLIPVLDVNTNPDNPIICTRAFSDDPETVAWFGKEYITVLEDKGLLGCAKHFPGHGSTSTDSHISMPVISKPGEEIIAKDIFPFCMAIESGVSSIMIGHLKIPAFDRQPATISSRIIQGILRRDLGFNGLVLTDALNMHALKGLKNVATACIDAGADIILHPDDEDSAVDEICSAIRSGRLSEERIDESAERILSCKRKILKTEKKGFNRERNERLAALISERSITLVRNSPDILPVKGKEDIVFFVAGDSAEKDIAALENYAQCRSISEHEGVSIAEGIVIIGLFTEIAAWHGTSGISEDTVRDIKTIISRAGHTIIVSFGSPYVLRHFPGADVLIAAYDSSPSAQKAVIRCLEGEIDSSGRLPVRMDL